MASESPLVSFLKNGNLRRFLKDPSHSTINFISISANTTAKNDCAILVLLEFLTLSHPRTQCEVPAYWQLIKKIQEITKDFYEEIFKRSWNPNEDQLHFDLFKNVLGKYIPNHQVDLYKFISKRNQAVDVNIEYVNEGGPPLPLAICLKSSWDHQANAVGSGHFVLIDTDAVTKSTTSTIQDTILELLRQKKFGDSTKKIIVTEHPINTPETRE